ncbi:MAG TPA: serine protease [Stellaceae bacterium]|nr:serine protease [Stellaceae bacterium]
MLRLLIGAWLVLVAGWAAPVLAAGPSANGEGAAGRVKSGTGFFVSRDGFLVTSAHVITGCQDISIWGSDGVERPSYTIASDPRLDLALLWADGKRLGPSAVAARTPHRAGEDVFTLGFGIVATTPLRPVLVEGSLVGDSTAKPGNRILMIRARLHAGNSGGAVLAGDGSLVGMVVGRDEAHPDLGVAIPTRDIEALLASYGIVLPKQDPARDARDFLGAISVLIQCAAPGVRAEPPGRAGLAADPTGAHPR